MANPNGSRYPSLIPSVPPSPIDARHRRDSLASASVVSHSEREHLSVTLDKIHTSASQSDALTTFNDFTAPPGSVPVSENKGTAGEIVQQGLSGLYSRIKEAVSAVGKTSAQEVDDAASQDGTSRRTSVSPAARGEGNLASSTFESSISSDFPTSGHATASTESQSNFLQSSKASSITTASASKPQPPSVQSLPRVSKTSASSTVNTDASRVTTVREELPSRNSGRLSLSRPSDLAASPAPSENASLDSVAITDRIIASSRGRRDDALTIDGTADTPLSPTRASAAPPGSSPLSRAPPAELTRRPTVLDRITLGKKPGHSRSSSIEPGTAEASPIITSAHSSVYHDSFTYNERPQRLKSGAMKIPGTTTNEGAPEMVNARLEQMRKQVLSKEFWMADETTKECFLCGSPFSAFRRKHHCRTCGCIFDSKCTSNISGAKFGVQGSLRVCKTCLNVINRRYESGSDDSADESYLPAIFRTSGQQQQQTKPPNVVIKQGVDDEASISERTEQADDTRTASTPMMAIPATRRVGDSNRHSAILEIDMPNLGLSRPSSSRSLKSLSTSRPQSSGHRRLHSKHNFLTRFKASPDERAPFRKPASDDPGKKSNVNAFHADNIIDPELADYMSDESTGDEQMSSIFATMNSNDFQPASLDPDRSSFGAYLTAGRKHRFRVGEKSTSGLSFTSRGAADDTGGAASGGLQSLSIHARPARRRNMSVASINVHHLRSPRPKSAIIKGPSASGDAFSIFEPGGENTGLKRTDSGREGKHPEEGLPPASMQHVKKLFRQLLGDAEIPNPASWERALIPILDKCADDVDPDIRNGDDMDIRHWVKLKKIPGGKPSDTAYVHGVVFTKNLALKSMPRKIRNPKIVIITFPLEYQRHPEQHFMSLQPVIEQEKEYLRMVVNRILNLEPHVLLVERSVAGVALQYLSDANVAVAYNVKPSVIEAVSRIVNMPVISSMDMLSLGAHVGTCESFEVKTYVNNGIKGRKKTYLFFSGCAKDRGCTIALRGASTQTLARMKRITEFMVYVVYNLKLESCLMRDEFVQIPTEVEPLVPSNLTSRQPTDDSLLLKPGCVPDPTSPRPHILITGQATEGEQALQASDGATADPEQPPPTTDAAPQPTADSAQRLISLHESHSHVQVPEDVPMPTFYSDMVDKYETRLLSSSPFVRFTQPYLLMKAREQERRLVYLRRLRDQDIVEDPDESEKLKSQRFQLIKPEMVHEIGQKAPRQIMEVLHAVHDAEYDKALHNYQTQARQWETYIQDSLDLFDPYSHQNIVVLYSVTCTATKIPCVEPGLVAIEFYNEHPDMTGQLDQDCTLGQYIEDICEGAEVVCHSNGCDRKMYEHHRTYVHDNARITIMLDKSPAWPENFPEKPQENDGDKDGTGICMWNYCKECKKDFGLMPMSVSTWKYSFGKYLELSFWSRCTRSSLQTECPHDHQKDHIRFFYYVYRDIAVRIHYDPIDLYEIIVPRPRLTWKVDHDLRLKNDIFTNVQDRWIRFTTSVRARLKSIRIDSVLPEKAEACTAEIERLTKKAHDDQAELLGSLQKMYMTSKYYEVIPLNTVIRGMLEKVTDWDAAFAKFEADFLSDKDVRQLTIIQLKKMFTDNESKESLPSTDGTTMGSESDDKTTPSASQPSEFDEKQSQHSEGDFSQLPESQPQDETLSPTSQSTVLPVEGSADQVGQILEKIEPLDLATPTSPTLLKAVIASSDGGLGTSKPETNQSEPSSSVPESTPPVSSTVSSQDSRVPEQHMTLTEKVEQLRREQRAASGDDTGESSTDAVRAAAERSVIRKAGSAVSPPITRALSQPVGTLPRTQSAIGKLLKEQRAQDAAAEAQKALPDAPTKTEKRFSERLSIGALKNRKAAPSGIPRYVHARKESKVSALAHHFEQLSREFEKERMRDRKQRAANMQQNRAFLPRSSTKTTVKVYKDVDQAVQEPGPDEDNLNEKDQGEKKSTEISRGAPDVPRGKPSEPTEADAGSDLIHEMPEQSLQHEEGTADAGVDIHGRGSQAGSDDEGEGSDVDNSSLKLDEYLPDTKEELATSLEPSEEMPEELPRHQKKSLMAMLTNFWAERSASNWTQLEYPISATDHIFFDSDVIVREDEPSSLIAFALSSEDYTAKLGEIRQRWKMSNQRETDDSSDGLEMKKPAQSAAAAAIDKAELENSLLRSTGTHLKYQFTEGSAKMMCKIFFAEQFDALRRKCGAADRFVESLSRCLKWDSKGGKTKSVFLKTLDDRFVLKSLSPIETTSFLKFAPDYFDLMAHALFHDLPSVIAKMLGFFQIIIKNPLTNTEIKLDLLVMENLFYDRSPSRTFDLKGSMRNRRIQSTGEQNEVLLDENMVEYIYESPLFAREHSKRLLRTSVFNDTLFLARQGVMDYSLMVAVDEVKKELVVGIIDCIRTYTWDKQLESWIKNRGFAGGGRNRPTVTSPREYKSRFREAMARYILQAPNCWHVFGNHLPPPQSNTPATPRTRFEDQS
ncbi:putative phosphatidylinositol-4-phosphate 5-kinase [Podospora fimiseda]|uniref:1-phosphatidylinositol-3-phosphate 5-kinase n=1 Tax=Podospora fimiseda TaxID=252190 RepID=A0AAN7BU50_9PEZI|nr:putative phosphatidylinositol-4-phosphate 5-kinase [Podospora fimiseda]